MINAANNDRDTPLRTMKPTMPRNGIDDGRQSSMLTAGGR